MTAPAADVPILSGLTIDTPCAVAARRVLKLRLNAVERLLPRACDPQQVQPRDVHQLRVATRRAAAALRSFGAYCSPRARRQVRDLLRSVRRRAAEARQADVQIEYLREAVELAGGPAAHAELVSAIQADRAAAIESLHQVGASEPWGRLNRARKRLLKSIQRTARRLNRSATASSARSPVMLGELAAIRWPDLLAPVVAAVAEPPTEIPALHSLRIGIKRLRYSLEILGGCLPAEFVRVHYRRVEEMQAQLGAINDLFELAARVERLRNGRNRTTDAAPAPSDSELRALHDDLGFRTQRARDAFLAWWQSADARHTICALEALRPMEPPVGRLPHLPRLHAPPDDLSPARGHPPRRAVQIPDLAHPHRVAAIDIGSNTSRLVVAESCPDARFRVVEDFGETVRLASGLYRTGRLSHESMEEALTVLARMREIVEHHHVDRLRAVGTSALREARNAGKFLRMAHKRCGIAIETIRADYEARLAFASVANAFDLNSLRAACVDLGGGSADIVLSENGLIDAIHTLPLGAVRLTDMHSDPTTPGVYRYGDMARSVDKALKRALGAVPPVDLLIGTGGTFTTLARISIRRGDNGNAEGRFPFAVRGYELSLAQVRDILHWLRDMPLEERRRVPGLSERRSEIIVAGLCVIERMMRLLRVARLRVHDGGIRDGMLMEMIDELHLLTPPQADTAAVALAAVRRLAERCEYPREHSEHVARLSLRIFDQLTESALDRAAVWARPGARDLLHAAAVLHDVGQVVEFRRHHKHGYALITHADLSPLSRRQVELIANIVRYHRRARPSARHACFGRLSVDDQHLVTDLAGILRIADGLDRLQSQNVRDVDVNVHKRHVQFTVQAASDPGVNLQFAARKADVFRRRFGKSVKFAAADVAGAVIGSQDVVHAG